METKSEHYPVTWVYGTLNDQKCWLGFCGKTRMLYHISPEGRGGINGLVPLIVNYLIIDRNGECEMATGCMNQQCPLNRTTPASWWKFHALPGPPPPTKTLTFSGLALPDDIRAESKIVTSKDGGPILALNTRKVA